MSTEELRKRLMHVGLTRDELNPNPIKQFENWYAQSIETQIVEPGAMSLATVDSNGQPWQRMVLLKIFDEQGFVFFTNYSSRKALQIADSPRVSLLFPWHALARQVKITGRASKISTAESLKYFVTRPRGSQIGAWASPQSQVVSSRALLDGMFAEMKAKYAEGHVPLPSHWGGYRVTPESLEFWQARENRLHDRFLYTRETAQTWVCERLAP